MDPNKPAEATHTNSELHASWVTHSEVDSSHELPGPTLNPEERLPSGENNNSQATNLAPEHVISSRVLSSESAHSYKTFVVLGVILTIIACMVIGGIAFMTILTKNKNNQNQVVNLNVSPSVMPTSAMMIVSPNDIVKDIVLTNEDPSRPGVPVEKKIQFLKTDKMIYATVVLNKPAMGTRVSYARYLNSNYMDHGTIIIDQQNTKYVHFGFELINEKVVRSSGNYELKIYINDTWVKTIDYTVS